MKFTKLYLTQNFYIFMNGQIYHIFTMLSVRESGDLADFSDNEYKIRKARS